MHEFDSNLSSDVMHSDTEAPYPNPRYAWYVVIVLFVTYTLSFVDRQIMSLLVEPIKRDLDLNDTQFSLLHGFAFAIFYTLMGLPLGRLADRSHRPLIIACGVFLWSLMTAICGLTKTFTQLFFARVGVGVGEAALSPAAYSMISDYFPQEKRSLATSMYSMAVFFGSGIAFIVGGYVVQLASGAADITFPLVGTIRPWQLTFFIVGIPGIFAVALMLTVKEPQRRDIVSLSEGSNDARADDGSIRATLMYAVRHKRVYGFVLLGFALLATASYGFFTWTPSFLIRTYGWEASDAGYSFGLLVLILGTGGTLLGGVLAGRVLAMDKLDANLRIAMYAGAGIMIFGCLAPLMPSGQLALLFLAPTVLFLGFPVGLAPAALNFITPNQLRGQVIALYVFAVNLIGLGIGPTLIALITDYGFGDAAALRYSMAVFAVVISALAMLCLMRGMEAYRARAKALLQ